MDESYDIARNWFDALNTSVVLSAFCQERFGKAPAVSLGYPMDEKPGEDIAPYVFVIPVKDDGGFEEEFSHATVLVALGLIDEGQDAVGAGTVHKGYESVRLFEQAVLAVLRETDFPPSSWEGDTAQPGPGYFERHTFHRVTQARTIGGNY